MADTLMSALAMFLTKSPSMLAFEDQTQDLRIEKPFQIQGVPSDTQMRTILDGIDVEPLNEAFADLFWELQRGRELKQWLFDDQYYLIAIDGSGQFCSDKVSCQQCMVRVKGGKQQYYHQVVAAVLVHPLTRQVIPMAVEPILRGDGQNKNDCERNATSRLLKRLRKQHPKLKMLILEDGLASNGPHIADLQSHNMHFLLGAKPGDHQYLFEQVVEAMGRDDCRCESLEVANGKKKITTENHYVADLSLNKSHRDLRINFLQHYEFDDNSGEVAKRFSWVTDLDLSKNSLDLYQRAGRCRWRVENETFNTLKNQGYHLEHNYGHGSKNLATVLVLLTFLAFLVDQIQEACCGLFNAAMKRVRRRVRLWESLRSHLRHFEFASFADLYTAIATGRLTKPPPVG
ncbi:MAG: transposase [Erythrobacter sp.]